MNVNQMRAWLTIEGWIPCEGDPNENWYPAAFNLSIGMGCIDWPAQYGGSIESLACHNDTVWGGVTNWDRMSDSQVEAFYNHITQGETK